MDKDELVRIFSSVRTLLEKAEWLIDDVEEEDVPIDFRSDFREVRDLVTNASYEAYCLEGALEEEEEEDEQAA